MSPHILVVDDDRSVQEMLTDTLQEGGYTVSACGDGKQVMPLLEKDPIDLLILDMLIPHVNGFALMEQIRAHPTLKELPVVLISGIYRGRNHRAEMIDRLGAVDYLDKPLVANRLLELVEKILGQGEEAEPQGHLADPDAHVGGFILQGQIAHTHVAVVLGHLWRQQQSGALLLRQERVRKIIYIRKGSAFWVKSNRTSECLGQVLVRERLITEAQCRESLLRMRETRQRQGEILVDMHAITHKNLEVALEIQLETKLFDTFSWDQGDFRFNREARLPQGGVALEWSGPALVVEGIRRHIGEIRLREFMTPILDVPIRLQVEKEFDWTQLKLSPKHSCVIDALEFPENHTGAHRFPLFGPSGSIADRLCPHRSRAGGAGAMSASMDPPFVQVRVGCHYPRERQRFRLMHVINRHARESGYPESFDFSGVTGSPRARG